MKRLFYDLEVSPNVGFFWQSGHKISVGYESIIKEREIICICYKWEHQKTVKYLVWDEKQSDKKLVKEFCKVLSLADEVCGHNGDNFDLKWLRTRALKHGVKMSPYIKSYDTLKEARKLFRFNSNRLDYIGKFLDKGSKISTSYDLWRNIILNKDKKALKEMVEYCKRDVELLQEIFNKMQPYIKAKTHVGEWGSDCPECGSSNTVVNQRRIAASGNRTVTLQCTDCGKYHSMPESKYNKEQKLKK